MTVIEVDGADVLSLYPLELDSEYSRSSTTESMQIKNKTLQKSKSRLRKTSQSRSMLHHKSHSMNRNNASYNNTPNKTDIKEISNNHLNLNFNSHYVKSRSDMFQQTKKRILDLDLELGMSSTNISNNSDISNNSNSDNSNSNISNNSNSDNPFDNPIKQIWYWKNGEFVCENLYGSITYPDGYTKMENIINNTNNINTNPNSNSNSNSNYHDNPDPNIDIVTLSQNAPMLDQLVNLSSSELNKNNENNTNILLPLNIYKNKTEQLLLANNKVESMNSQLAIIYSVLTTARTGYLKELTHLRRLLKLKQTDLLIESGTDFRETSESGKGKGKGKHQRALVSAATKNKALKMEMYVVCFNVEWFVGLMFWLLLLLLSLYATNVRLL